MSRIKIMPDKMDTAKPKSVPRSSDLSMTVPRCRPPGGKPPLQIDKIYNTQGKK